MSLPTLYAPKETADRSPGVSISVSVALPYFKSDIPYVPASALEDANEENKRLRVALTQITEGAPERKPDIESMLESDDRDGIALVSEELEHYRCATIARAALAPKES